MFSLARDGENPPSMASFVMYDEFVENLDEEILYSSVIGYSSRCINIISFTFLLSNIFYTSLCTYFTLFPVRT